MIETIVYLIPLLVIIWLLYLIFREVRYDRWQIDWKEERDKHEHDG